MSLVFVTGDIYIFLLGNGQIDDVIVIGWTDSDFKISRALHHSKQSQALLRPSADGV